MSNSDVMKILSKKSWPFREAELILNRTNGSIPNKGYVLFETGYGPSGLPHMGTFMEVARTTMVQKAFEALSGFKTKLIVFSDDMDGLRKIPKFIPNNEVYEQYLDLPLTEVPDPFGIEKSFGDNMNARLKGFLKTFGFNYEFMSATESYRNGILNRGLLAALDHYEEIMELMLSSLREERRKTYSIFMPLCPITGKVLQVPTLEIDKKEDMIAYANPYCDNKVTWTKITDGRCKLQWKPDFAMRWMLFDVDFEMYGKDHLYNAPIYTQICKILGGKPPHQMFYEFFLAEDKTKLSKSIGGGLTIEEWLRYAPQESLSYFLYLSPQKAKILRFDIIPKNVDDYIHYLNLYNTQETVEEKWANPIFHIHCGSPPSIKVGFNYTLLLSIISACKTENIEVILGYINKINPDINCKDNAFLMELIKGAMNYYHDFIMPNKQYKVPDYAEKEALISLKEILEKMNEEERLDVQFIQNQVYTIGKQHGFVLKEWFSSLYQILLGATEGPRMGTFIKIYGADKTIALIEEKIMDCTKL